MTADVSEKARDALATAIDPDAFANAGGSTFRIGQGLMTSESLREDARERASKYLTALAAAGFAVVPVEPTSDMEIQGALKCDFDAVGMPSRKRAGLTYRAMLAAAKVT